MKIRLVFFAAVAGLCALCAPVEQFQQRLQAWVDTHQALIKRYHGFLCVGAAYFGSGDVDSLVCAQECTAMTDDVPPEEFPVELASGEAAGNTLCSPEQRSATFLHP